MESFGGWVRDSGGGVVTIVVHRDTEEYPQIGQIVVVTSIEQELEPPKEGMVCCDCLTMPKSPTQTDNRLTVIDGFLLCLDHIPGYMERKRRRLDDQLRKSFASAHMRR